MPRQGNESNLALGVWIASIVLLTLITLTVGTAWTVKHAMLKGPRLTASQTQAALKVASLPSEIKAAVVQMASTFGGKPYPLLIDKVSAERKYWHRIFPSKADTGYLLLSGLDPRSHTSTVRLLRVADGKEVGVWNPDWNEISQKTSENAYTGKLLSSNARAFHPLLLPDGDIVFNTGASLVRMGVCTRKPKWIVDRLFHHSNELDNEGNIWTPSTSQKGLTNNEWLRDRIKNDSIAKISPDGKILENISLAEILLRNGLQALLFGTTGFQLNNDPTHINQISVARTQSEYWNKGDILISARHLSAVFLYRPSTGKIIWHKTGPWMNQHDAEFVGDHQISIFNNNVISGASSGHAFIDSDGFNGVMLYDFKTNSVLEPYGDILKSARPSTITEGRARILPDGGLFIEETNSGRHLRFGQNGLMWSRVNDYDTQHIGLVSWSRYLTKEEVEEPLRTLQHASCW